MNRSTNPNEALAIPPEFSSVSRYIQLVWALVGVMYIHPCFPHAQIPLQNAVKGSLSQRRGGVHTQYRTST